MKIQILTAVLVAMTANLASAALFTGTPLAANSGVVPDGNPVGFVSTMTVNTFGDNNAIDGVRVTLNLSGGYNGDLFGYLVNPNGDLALLLNHVGTGPGGSVQNLYGYADAGMNVVLSDNGIAGWSSTVGDIHTYGGGVPPPGTVYRPDNGTFDFSALHNGSAQGTWTLFLADLSAGGETTLLSWGLDVHVVPEPSTWALILFGAVAAGTVAVRRVRRSAA
jgi:subtilisin-like proprotein convertase family protein